MRAFVFKRLASQDQAIRELSIQWCLSELGRQERLPEQDRDPAANPEILEGLRARIDVQPNVEWKERISSSLQGFEEG